jgi:hypothetical protein
MATDVQRLSRNDIFTSYWCQCQMSSLPLYDSSELHEESETMFLDLSDADSERQTGRLLELTGLPRLAAT